VNADLIFTGFFINGSSRQTLKSTEFVPRIDKSNKISKFNGFKKKKYL